MEGLSFNYEYILPPHWKTTVQRWLDEDVPGFDIGGLVVGNKLEVAELYIKSRGILAGKPFFDEVMRSVGCEVDWLFQEGDQFNIVDNKKMIARVTGPCRNILIGERTALNVLSRCSGVATVSNDAVQKCKEIGWHGMIAGTRKTTPGFRLVEKYGLIVGGAATHRYDLSQMVMLKDNHIMSAGSVTKAVQLAKGVGGFSIKIEVEAGTYETALEAARAGADVVMLDNFDPLYLQTTARLLKRDFPTLLIEASGGITSETMQEYMGADVDIISRGSFTQGYQCIDFSLKILSTA